MLPKETVELVLKTGQERVNVVSVFEDTHKKHLLVRDGDDLVLKIYDKEREEYLHRHESLESFVEYINKRITDHGQDKLTIWVNRNGIIADLNENYPNKYRTGIKFASSEEMLALQSLVNGIYQRHLWKSLITDLDGCFDDALLLAVSSIRTNRQIGRDTSLDVTGISTSKAEQSIHIEFNDAGQNQSARIGLNWTWTGRLWSCWDRTVEIFTRLELGYDDNKHALSFTFHPRRLSQVYEQACTDVVNYLKQELPGIEIYQGSATA